MGDKMKPRRVFGKGKRSGNDAGRPNNEKFKKDFKAKDNKIASPPVFTLGQKPKGSSQRSTRTIRQPIKATNGVNGGLVSTGNNDLVGTTVKQTEDAMLQFIPMNKSEATFREPILPSAEQLKKSSLTDDRQTPGVSFAKGGKPRHSPMDERLPDVTKLVISQPLEVAVVKYFNGAEGKLFGFATTQYPNESGKPELFFHLNGGCVLYLNESYDPRDPQNEHAIDMVFCGRTGVKLPHPVNGDELCVIRGYGNQGEKIVKWCYHRDYDAALYAFLNPEKYRLVRKVTEFGGRGKPAISCIWEGTSLAKVRNAFPKWRLGVGLKSIATGTESIYFEKLVTPVIGGVEVWEKCDDPR